MKSVIACAFICSILMVSLSLAKPMSDDDDSSTTSMMGMATGMDKESMTEHDSVQNSTMTDDNGDADDSDEDDDNNSDANSEVVGFNVALFPTSSLFGPNMFQKLQESLRVIRDQLNNMWTMSNNTSNFMDIPDDYNNSTSKTQIINGTVVTVNETITKKNEDGVQSVYHVRVISLRPENDTDSSSVQQQQMGQQKVALPSTSSPITTDVTTMAAVTTTVAPATSTTNNPTTTAPM